MFNAYNLDDDYSLDASEDKKRFTEAISDGFANLFKGTLFL